MYITWKNLMLENLQFVPPLILAFYGILREAYKDIRRNANTTKTVRNALVEIFYCIIFFGYLLYLSVKKAEIRTIFEEKLSYIPPSILVAIRFALVLLGYELARKLLLSGTKSKSEEKSKGFLLSLFILAFSVYGGCFFYFHGMELLIYLSRVLGFTDS